MGHIIKVMVCQTPNPKRYIEDIPISLYIPIKPYLLEYGQIEGLKGLDKKV
jgi:hypothetical protein